MALSKNDQTIIRAIFKEELEPTKEKLQTVHQTVYGSDGKGGMKAEVIRHDKEIESWKVFRTQVRTALFAIFPAVQVLIALVIEWVKERLH